MSEQWTGRRTAVDHEETVRAAEDMIRRIFRDCARASEARDADARRQEGRRLQELGEHLSPVCSALCAARNVQLVLAPEPVRLPADLCARVGRLIGRLLEDAAPAALAGRNRAIRVGCWEDRGYAFCSVVVERQDWSPSVRRRLRIQAAARELEGLVDWRNADGRSAALLAFPLPGRPQDGAPSAAAAGPMH
jgi:hypothetical protein